MKYLAESTGAGFLSELFHVILLAIIPFLLHPALLSRRRIALTGHHVIIISDPGFGWSLSEEVRKLAVVHSSCRNNILVMGMKEQILHLYAAIET